MQLELEPFIFISMQFLAVRAQSNQSCCLPNGRGWIRCKSIGLRADPRITLVWIVNELISDQRCSVTPRAVARQCWAPFRCGLNWCLQDLWNKGGSLKLRTWSIFGCFPAVSFSLCSVVSWKEQWIVWPYLPATKPEPLYNPANGNPCHYSDNHHPAWNTNGHWVIFILVC